MEGEDSHSAEGIFKLLRKYLGEDPDWHPGLVQRKFVLESKKVWRSKQKLLRSTNDFLAEERFLSALRNGTNFIVCFQTKNVKSEGVDSQESLSDFLCSQYREQYIWAVGRSRTDPKRPFNLYSKDFIEIPDLKFDRKNPIHAICPINDILALILVEEKEAVSILINNEYLKIKPHRKKRYLEPTVKYRNFFKKMGKKSSKNKENEDPSHEAGPSGLNRSQSSQSIRSQSSQSIRSQEPRSNESNSAVCNESSRSGINTDDTGLLSGVSDSQPNPSEKSYADLHESSDESDDNQVDKTRKIIFKRNYAEITSHGITQKIEIATANDYRERISKVGFQISILFSLF